MKLMEVLLKEYYTSLEEVFIDEMAYPTEFDIETFKNIRSFAGKQKYANEKLRGRIGSGSGRIVFRIDDEKVLKIALNDRGITQNETEAEGYKQNYDAIAKVFDTAEDDTWLEMELAKKISLPRFRQLTGTNPVDLGNWLAHIMGGRASIIYGKVVDLRDNEFAEEILNFAEDYNYPAPGDFGKISSYGEVLRDGTPKVVMVDFGFDSNSAAKYNKWRKDAAAKRNNNYGYRY